MIVNHLQLFSKNPRVNICTFQHFRQLKKACEDGGFERIFNLSLAENIKNSQARAQCAILPFYIKENEMSFILMNFAGARGGLYEYLLVTGEKNLESINKLIFRISEMSSKLLLNDLWRNKEQVINTEDFILQNADSHRRNIITSCLLSKLCERERNFEEMKNILQDKYISSLEFNNISSIIAASRTFSVVKLSGEDSLRLSNQRVLHNNSDTLMTYPRVRGNTPPKSRLFLEEKHRINPVLDSSWQGWGVSVPKYKKVRSRDPVIEAISDYYIKKIEKTAGSFHESLLQEKRLSGILSKQVQEDRIKTSDLKRKLSEQDRRLARFSEVIKQLKIKIQECESERLKHEILSLVNRQNPPQPQIFSTSLNSAGGQSLPSSISSVPSSHSDSESLPVKKHMTRRQLSRIKKSLPPTR